MQAERDMTRQGSSNEAGAGDNSSGSGGGAVLHDTEDAVRLLHDVARDVDAVWCRAGHDAHTRHARWAEFVRNRLMPYLCDYRAMAVAEERACAVRNDVLLQRIFFLSVHLRTAPRRPAPLRRLVRAGLQCYARGDGDVSDHTTMTTTTTTVTASVQKHKLQQSPSYLPSFTQWLPSLDAHAHTTSATAGNACGDNDDGSNNSSSSRSEDEVAQAMRRWVCAAGHAQIHGVLQRALHTLHTQAATRLHWLCLVRRFRAALLHPPRLCAALRQRYAAQYARGTATDGSVHVEVAAAALPDGDASVVSTAVQLRAAVASAAAAAAVAATADAAATTATARSTTASSRAFASAQSTTTAAAPTTATTTMTADVVDKVKIDAAIEADVATTTTTSAAVDEELRLLLAASRCSDYSADVRNTSVLLLHHHQQPRSTTATTRATVTSTQHGATEATTSTLSAVHADAPHEAVTQHATRCSGDNNDDGDDDEAAVTRAVLRYGTRQDLSLSRIAREAAAVWCAAHDTDARMQHEASDELRRIDALYHELLATTAAGGVGSGDSGNDSSNSGSGGGASVGDEEGVLPVGGGGGDDAEAAAALMASRVAFYERVKALRDAAMTRGVHATDTGGDADGAAAAEAAAAAYAAAEAQECACDGNEADDEDDVVWCDCSSDGDEHKDEDSATAMAAATVSDTHSNNKDDDDDDVEDDDAVVCALSTRAPTRPHSLPPWLRCLFALPTSAATLLDLVRSTRVQLQHQLMARHLSRVQHVSAQLRDAYAAYFDLTHDPAYTALPDYALWLPQEQQQQQHQQQQTKDSSSGNGGDDDGADDAASVQQWQLRIAQATHVVQRATDELCVLQRRLVVLRRVAPLLRTRTTLLAEQRSMQENSRARLLSKKVNMAKQLLHEEALRRRIARELPAIATQLRQLLHEWAQLHAHDTAAVARGGSEEEVGALAATTRTMTAVPPLCVCGIDVAQLLATDAVGGAQSKPRTALHAATTSATSTRARSTSTAAAAAAATATRPRTPSPTPRLPPTPLRHASSTSPRPPPRSLPPQQPSCSSSSPALRRVRTPQHTAAVAAQRHTPSHGVATPRAMPRRAVTHSSLSPLPVNRTLNTRSKPATATAAAAVAVSASTSASPSSLPLLRKRTRDSRSRTATQTSPRMRY